MTDTCKDGQHHRDIEDKCGRCGATICGSPMPPALSGPYGGGRCSSTVAHAGDHLNANGPAIEWAARGI